MAITKSAKKAKRVSDRKRVYNDRLRKTMRADIKNVKDKVSMKSFENKDLALAFKSLDKAAKRGTIKKGTADRKKSRLSKLVNKSTK